MGSGSDNHFRLDLPASVAKLAGDGLLVFREDRREYKKKKNRESEKNYTRPGTIHHFQKPVKKTFSVVHVYNMAL